MHSLHRQNGVALITALLVVSLASILAASLLEHLYYDLRRTENIIRADQAELYNANAVQFARTLLQMDRTLNNEYDTLEEYSPKNEQLFPVPGGGVSAKLLDQQRCFNINNLSASNATLAQQKIIYRNLLQQAEIDSNLHSTLIDSLLDWLDEDDISQPMGAEFDYYIGLEPPYRSANQLMISVTELRTVKGYTPEVIKQLSPHVCVIPAINTAININTASLEMLESIPALAGHGAQIIQDRDGRPDTTDDDAPFASMNDFQRYAQQKLQIQNINTQGLQVYSEYFMMESYTNLGAGNIRLFSLIYRKQSDGSSEVIYQSRGTL